jgi:hypothetical protein
VNGFRRVHCNCTAAMRNQRRSVLRRRNARRFRAFYKRRLQCWRLLRWTSATRNF